MLSAQGWRRLQEAQTQFERQRNSGNPYTLEQLNELTGLSLKTLTKVRGHKTTVDRQTLADYFSAFNLALTANDYVHPDPKASPNWRPVTGYRGQRIVVRLLSPITCPR